ncbi:tetratricopeptide repeat protein [Herbidospora mongoliensis]|uniref:tetratricopeptide repeat protein n=1 Tax=Herbidospora mongoliensis TaxID=688067 RepID=UPI00083671F0|nr:tetratricopeptide repeat protein [Herbidospora mongoliensis]
MGRIENAKTLYEQAVFHGTEDALDQADLALDSLEADLMLARGRVTHARFLAGEGPGDVTAFERAVDLYNALGDVRGEAESLFWIGIFHQVVGQEDDVARPFFERARDLATEVGDRETLAYTLRHLAFASKGTPAARELLEESTRLRRELGFLPGVAANLLGLAYVARDEGRPGDAAELVAEAREAAEQSGADRVLKWVDDFESS